MRFLLLTLALSIPFLANAQLVDQQPSGSNFAYPSDGLSTNGSQFWAITSADNFSLSSASNVTQIQFWGGSLDGSGNLNSTGLDNLYSFDIEVFNSNFTSTLFATTLTTASLNPVATGNVLTNVTDGFVDGNEYLFTVNANFNLAAGNYWLAIGSNNLNPNGDAFGWTTATADGKYGYNLFDGNGWQVYQTPGATDFDQAFRINGSAQAVPEPSALILSSLGALILLARRR